jgi:hypothetical protein
MSQHTLQSIVDEDSAFAHQPLDLRTKSLRLIEVLPSNGDDLVMCTVRHVTTDATYTCLSYVWGPPEDGSRIIMLNDRPFLIRKNLWDFLSVASSDQGNLGVSCSLYPSFDLLQATKSLWIDALCIDQSNVTERNHQVQQMGDIYSHARQVIAWMGHDREIAKSFACSWLDIKNMDLFWNNEYWHRAWVTQEMVLARDICFVAAYKSLSYSPLLRLLMRRYFQESDATNSQYRTIFDIQESRKVHNPLIDNVERFKDKRCSDPRDRIYSLLSISSDGARIKVDYDTSVAELVYALCITDRTPCLCDAKTLDSVFATLEQRDPWNLAMADQPPLKLHVFSTVTHHGRCPHCRTSFRQDEHERYLLKNGLEWTDKRVYCLSCSHNPKRVIPHLVLARRNTLESVEVFYMAGGDLVKIPTGILLENMDADGNAVFSLSIPVYHELSRYGYSDTPLEHVTSVACESKHTRFQHWCLDKYNHLRK